MVRPNFTGLEQSKEQSLSPGQRQLGLLGLKEGKVKDDSRLSSDQL